MHFLLCTSYCALPIVHFILCNSYCTSCSYCALLCAWYCALPFPWKTSCPMKSAFIIFSVATFFLFRSIVLQIAIVLKDGDRLNGNFFLSCWKFKFVHLIQMCMKQQCRDISPFQLGKTCGNCHDHGVSWWWINYANLWPWLSEWISQWINYANYANLWLRMNFLWMNFAYLLL